MTNAIPSFFPPAGRASSVLGRGAKAGRLVPSAPSVSRPVPLLLLAVLAFVVGCEPRDLDAELAAAQADVASISNRLDRALGENEILKRALVAAMSRASDTEGELADVRAYCPRTEL